MTRFTPLVTGPDDTVVELATRARPSRRDPRRMETVYAVVHRSAGCWTHLYGVPQAGASGRGEVRLLAVLPGDRLDDARARFGVSRAAAE